MQAIEFMGNIRTWCNNQVNDIHWSLQRLLIKFIDFGEMWIVGVVFVWIVVGSVYKAVGFLFRLQLEMDPLLEMFDGGGDNERRQSLPPEVQTV